MTLNFANPYGMTFGVNPGSGNTGTPFSHWDRLLPDLALLGVKKIRFNYSWDSIEHPQGTTDFTVLDDAVSHLNAAGIEMTYVIRGAPTWAETNPAQQASDEPWILADPTMFANWCTTIGTRYDGTHGHGQIDRYEITNEEANIHFTPSGGGFHCTHASSSPYWGAGAGAAITNSNKYQPARDPQYFVTILPGAYDAFKAINSVPVGMGSLWWLQPTGDNTYNQPKSQMQTFLEFMYNNGMKGKFDYVNFHYYSNAVDDNVGNKQTEAIIPLINDLKAVVAANNDTIPCKITEFGWQVPTDVPDGATQWQQYKNLLDAARLSNFVDEVDFFTLAYQPNFATGSSLTSLDAGVETYRTPTFANLQNYIATYPLWPINSGGGGSGGGGQQTTGSSGYASPDGGPAPGDVTFPTGGYGISSGSGYTVNQGLSKIGNWTQRPPSLLSELEQEVYKLFKWFERKL